jgi:hypothetical protein
LTKRRWKWTMKGSENSNTFAVNTEFDTAFLIDYCLA